MVGSEVKDYTFRVEILYRKSTGSWKAVGYPPLAGKSRLVCGYGSLRRARRKSRQWLRENSEPSLFQVIKPESWWYGNST